MAERLRSKRIGYHLARAAAASAVLLVAACGGASDPVLPTARPTFTPSPEASPTPARIVNASLVPTRIPTATIDLAGPSPTPLIGDVPTRPRYTLTPTEQAIVPGGLQIDYFTTSATTLTPGDSLTLFWSVKGADRATIYRLDAKGKREQLWNVGRAGSLEVGTRSSDRDVVQFLLVVGDDTNHLDQTLAVPLKCTEPWFFEPQPEGCPASPPLVSTEAQQTFQRGLMIWVQAQSRIYVMFNDGQKPTWADYPDEFKDGQAERDPALVPPQGLLQPIRGFGLVWRTREQVRERLGWATTAEVAFDGALQGDASVQGGVMYLRARDGNVIELRDKGTSWKLVTP
jgi:hypothetical protein